MRQNFNFKSLRGPLNEEKKAVNELFSFVKMTLHR